MPTVLPVSNRVAWTPARPGERLLQAAVCFILPTILTVCSELPAKSGAEDSTVATLVEDVAAEASTSSETAIAVKPSFCKGAWMCDLGTCTREPKSAPAMGANAGNLKMIRDDAGFPGSEFMSILYHKEDCCWKSASSEAAILRIEPDGRLAYASDRISGAIVIDLGLSSAGSQVFIVNQFPVQPRPTIFHTETVNSLVIKLYTRKADGTFKILQVTNGGGVVYLGPAPGSPSSVDRVLMAYYDQVGGPQYPPPIRARLIDLTTGSTVWDKELIDKMNLAFAGDKPKLQAATSTHGSGGLHFMSGKLWLYSWKLLSPGMSEFSLREVGPDLAIGPKTFAIQGASNENSGAKMRAVGDNFYLSHVFANSKSLFKIDSKDGPVAMPEAYSNHGPEGWFDLVHLPGGDWLYSDDGLVLKRISPSGDVLWSAIHSDEESLRARPVQLGNRSYWTTQRFSGTTITQPAPGRFAVLYKLAQNPIPTPNPMDLTQPVFSVPQISPYYLHYFDLETGKPLCY